MVLERYHLEEARKTVDSQRESIRALVSEVDRLRAILDDAVEFLRSGTPIYPGSDVANAILEACEHEKT